MKKTLMMLVVVAVTGCDGYAVQQHQYAVNLDGEVCYGELYSEIELKPAVLEKNAGIARDVLVEGGIFQNTHEFCTWMKDLRIEVINAERIHGTKLGAYSPFVGIQLSKHGSSMVHEILHSVDYGRLLPSMGSHIGWDQTVGKNIRSYDYMAAYYKFLTKDEQQF